MFVEFPNKIIIGLTGQSGAGKSNVARVFKRHGFFVIDADVVARKVTCRPDIIKLLAENFGPEILIGEELNRKALAAIVFSDKKRLKHLDELLFPIICKDIVELIEGCRHKYILLDAPQLFESGLNEICDKIIAAISPREILIWRITSRDKISQEDAEKRLNSQLPQEFFMEKADYVIDTYNKEKSAEDQAEEIVGEILPHIDVFEF
jgi:dephospho-CoA kinase